LEWVKKEIAEWCSIECHLLVLEKWSRLYAKFPKKKKSGGGSIWDPVHGVCLLRNWVSPARILRGGRGLDLNRKEGLHESMKVFMLNLSAGKML
jgi:hypothetical protein